MALGLAFAHLGQTEQAIEKYQDALNLAPSLFTANYNYANLLRQTRRLGGGRSPLIKSPWGKSLILRMPI